MPGQTGYGQFCPVAMAAEILGSRWTIPVLRELLCGSKRFNELLKGVPRMSPALLSQRLRDLEHAGIVTREQNASGGPQYCLTEAGEDLRSIVEFRGMLEAVKGRQIMIDPQCSLFLSDDFGEQSMGSMRLLCAGIYRGHAIVIPIVLEMRGVAREQDPAGVAKMHQQRLMSRRVAGSREESGAAVTKHVEIAGQQFHRPLLLERCRLALGKSPVDLGLLDQQCRGRKQVDIADMVAMSV